MHSLTSLVSSDVLISAVLPHRSRVPKKGSCNLENIILNIVHSRFLTSVVQLILLRGHWKMQIVKSSIVKMTKYFEM